MIRNPLYQDADRIRSIAFRMLALVLCISVLTVIVSMHTRPCRLKRSHPPGHFGKGRILKTLKMAFLTVRDDVLDRNNPERAEAVDADKTVILSHRLAAQRPYVDIRARSAPLYLQHLSFLC